MYEINPKNGRYRSIGAVYAADGVWIDQNRHLLYVSQVLGAVVHVYDLTQGTWQRKVSASGMWTLDDYTLSDDGTILFGTEFLAGKVMSFHVNSDDDTHDGSTVLASGVKNPTSARWGCGTRGFESTSLFVTEGGGVMSSVKNRRLLELRNVRQ